MKKRGEHGVIHQVYNLACDRHPRTSDRHKAGERLRERRVNEGPTELNSGGLHAQFFFELP